MGRHFFIDDLRQPPSAEWVVVRSFEEALAYFNRHGVPQRISFDHDQGERLGRLLPTGMDRASPTASRHRDLPYCYWQMAERGDTSLTPLTCAAGFRDISEASKRPGAFHCLYIHNDAEGKPVWQICYHGYISPRQLSRAQNRCGCSPPIQKQRDRAHRRQSAAGAPAI